MEEIKVELEYLKARIEGVENLINVLHGPPPDELFLSGNLVADEPESIAHILACEVMGWEGDQVSAGWNPELCLSDAMMVFSKLAETMPISINNILTPTGYKLYVSFGGAAWAQDTDLCLAICQAALKMVNGE